MRIAITSAIALLTLTHPAMAQIATAPAAATIADAAWLAGRWKGEGLGGELHEGLSDPVGGQMVGYFTLAKGGKPVFHELMLIEEHAGALRVRVKHFGPDFVGWEEKAEAMDFPFVSAAPGELAFKGLAFRKEGADGMAITIRFKTADGTGRDEVLRYRRVP